MVCDYGVMKMVLSAVPDCALPALGAVESGLGHVKALFYTTVEG